MKRISLSLLTAGLALAALSGCNIERGTAFTVGEQLSVADQVAIEAAIAKVADLLYDRNTAADTSLADFARITARLARLQGRASLIPVSSSSPIPDTMFAIAVRSRDELTGEIVDFVLLWKGLDTEAFTVDRAVLIEQGGIDPDSATFMEVEPGAGQFEFVPGKGTLAFSSTSFTSGCTGLSDTPSSTCRAGRLQGTAVAGPDSPSYLYGNFGPTELVGFELVVR